MKILYRYETLFFIPAKCTQYVKYTYLSPLPPTCFGVCNTIFREIIALFAQKPYAFCNVIV